MAFTRKEFCPFLGSWRHLGCMYPQARTSDMNQPASNVDLEEYKSLKLDMTQWSYDEDNDCYYQLGIQYCTKPASKSVNTLSVFVLEIFLGN